MYDEKLVVEENKCADAFIECTPDRRRQAVTGDRISISIEGVEENNRYELNATTGDTSTPRGKQTQQYKHTNTKLVQVSSNK